MDDYRSKYYREGDMQIQPYQGGGGGGGRKNQQPRGGDFRSYSSSYVSSSAATTTSTPHQMNGGNNKDMKFKKAKSGGSSKIWCFNDPELQRKKRVAGYKVYSVQGNIKGTFRKSVRWIKKRYTKAVYGWW